MNRLRELRKKRALSQEALAKLLGVNQTAVSQWERGVTAPSAALLTKLCDILNTTSDFLLGISDEQDIYVWSDNDVMKAVSESLDTLCHNIAISASKGDDQTQKMTFDIMVELLHVLKNKNAERRTSMLSFLQATFSVSTHFADVCNSSTGSQDFENDRIDKARSSAVSTYSKALSDLQNSLLK